MIGRGAVGSVVARSLRDGNVPGAELAGLLARSGPSGRPDTDDLPLITLHEALREADLVVECANQQVVKDVGARILTAGTDLMIISVGALADDMTATALRAAGPGRLYASSGAIGGLDVLRAAARCAPFERITVTITKQPYALVQSWMDAREAARLRVATEPIEVFRGPARETADRFPECTNVAAAVALAVGDWAVVEVVIIADPAARPSVHEVVADGLAGTYRFGIVSRPSPERESSSMVTPYAVLSAISDLTGRDFTFR
ncbi:MAG: DUF108 domain-containing protein [Streptosporangiales bacterium]|nr:DUF108 domain-containing protein [Streptosporangiales bacterium]